MTDSTTPADTPAISDHDLQVAITLASLTYLDEDDSNPNVQRQQIEQFLAYGDLPTANWDLVWGPASNDLNLWYIARQNDTDHFALVIRGTVMTSWISKLGDADVLLVDPLIDDAPEGVKVAQGFVGAHDNLNGARDMWHSQTAWEYLAQNLVGGGSLDVVGHSLGGALAPIISLDAMQRHRDVAVRSLALAGMTPGNQAFSDWYVSKITNQQHSRFINRFDIIPKWYDELRDLQRGFDGGPSCPFLYRELMEGLIVLMSAASIEYVATPNALVFDGHLYATSDWTEEAEGQHDHLYYMYLTGVPVDVIQRRFKQAWNPPEGS